MVKDNSCERKKLYRRVAVIYPLSVILLGALFFIPAGSFYYWQAWTYLIIIFSCSLLVFTYFLKRDPKLLEKRIRYKEKIGTQKLIIKISFIIFLLAFLIPGLDYRFGWSQIPIAIEIIAHLAIIAGFIIFFFVMKKNSYASRIVEIQKDQKVITDGPYRYVRHPMYVSVLIIYLSSPVALGSWWGLLTILPIALILIARIINEEKLLIKGLPGYKEYMEKTKYRLIPFIW